MSECGIVNITCTYYKYKHQMGFKVNAYSFQFYYSLTKVMPHSATTYKWKH